MSDITDLVARLEGLLAKARKRVASSRQTYEWHAKAQFGYSTEKARKALAKSEADAETLQMAVTALPALLAAVREGEWRPIESAPKDGTEFLCRWCPPQGKPATIIAKWCEGGWAHGFNGVNVANGVGDNTVSALTYGFDGGKLYATDWRPLPSPPTHTNTEGSNGS